MSNHTDLPSISTDQLADVTGAGWGWVKPVAKFAGKKLLGPASAAYSGYAGTSKFLDDRDHGKSIKTSLKDGLKAALF
jgi:hypothetical protein